MIGRYAKSEWKPDNQWMHEIWKSCFFTTDNCITTSGPDPRRPCVFPFIHEMVEYDTCTEAGHDQLWYNGPWCPTEVDIDPFDDKGYAVVPGKWGNCAQFPPCTVPVPDQ